MYTQMGRFFLCTEPSHLSQRNFFLVFPCGYITLVVDNIPSANLAVGPHVDGDDGDSELHGFIACHLCRNGFRITIDDFRCFVGGRLVGNVLTCL